ncbi:heme-binding protein 1-like [Latimeria chalumnae]|uniref:heme-binding protein 1-like n=1 Tax=Latimeria chalumnae TaxID=7897 RepID=UPI00313BDEBA
MRRSRARLAFLCLLALNAAVGNSSLKELPLFCHKLDCSKYTLVKQGDCSEQKVPDRLPCGPFQTFEERSYEASHWMTTLVEGLQYEDAMYDGFMRLFKYINGNNVAGEKIPMTAPVLVHVIPKGGDLDKNFTVSFFVPPASMSPPKPLDSRIYLDSHLAQTVYVRSFGGYMEKSDFVANADALEEDLKAAGKSFNEKYYMSAGYDSPFRPLNRHNEVWFIAVQ